MIDILYVLGPGSHWANNELRYSLRSVCKFATGVGRVFVVGNDPGFLHDVEVRAVPDPPGNKEFRIAWQIMWASENTDISEDFLMFNDDHFLVGNVYAPAYPLYQTGTLEKKAERANCMKYRQSLLATRDRLQLLGKPTTSFEPHTPIIFSRSHFAALRAFWEESRIRRCGYVARSLYCNYYGLVGSPIKDCKLRNVKGVVDVLERIEDRDVFSISDVSIPLGVADALARLFPEKCRFED